ncbi:uncharacterized protein METZ01_LOCUS413846 [marine metagenome]|uniref:Uncharacterized protein n=1 Tax=marine metagenome TaxID=408172 RepID=A0A382WQ62_9ZZZZ
MQFSGIGAEKITERKSVLAQDISNVQRKLELLNKELRENENLLQALIGASQQCDHFLKEIHNEESDVENSSEED